MVEDDKVIGDRFELISLSVSLDDWRGIGIECSKPIYKTKFGAFYLWPFQK